MKVEKAKDPLHERGGGRGVFFSSGRVRFSLPQPPLLEPPSSYAAIAARKSWSLGRDSGPNFVSWDEEINLPKAVNRESGRARDALFRFVYHYTKHMHSAAWEPTSICRWLIGNSSHCNTRATGPGQV